MERLKLYHVTYYAWNMFFSDKVERQTLAVGTSVDDAIARVKALPHVPNDARGFDATAIEKVMGHKITVDDKD